MAEHALGRFHEDGASVKRDQDQVDAGDAAVSRCIVDAAIANLERAERLIRVLDDHAYANAKSGPYFSSIGSHIRHILDIFACVIHGAESGVVDLTDRRRGTAAESVREKGLEYVQSVIRGLGRLAQTDPATPVRMLDDLGLGMKEIPSTLGAGLCQAHSHAIHHYACIGYLLHLQGLKLPDPAFGFNPTTPIPIPQRL